MSPWWGRCHTAETVAAKPVSPEKSGLPDEDQILQVLDPPTQAEELYCGTEDDFRLEGATRLLQEELARLGSDAEGALRRGAGPRFPDATSRRTVAEGTSLAHLQRDGRAG